MIHHKSTYKPKKKSDGSLGAFVVAMMIAAIAGLLVASYVGLKIENYEYRQVCQELSTTN